MVGQRVRQRGGYSSCLGFCFGVCGRIANAVEREKAVSPLVCVDNTRFSENAHRSELFSVCDLVSGLTGI